MKNIPVLTVYSESNHSLYSVKKDKDSYYMRKHTYTNGSYISSRWILTTKQDLLDLGVILK